MSYSVRTPRAGERPGAMSTGRPLPLAYTIVLSVVLVGATLFGLLVEGGYRVSPGVRQDLADVMRGQDLLTLLTVPVLIWTARRALEGSLRMHLVWLGLLLYYAYSFLIYAFAPYNDVFLTYPVIICMSGYGLLDGLFRLDMRVVAPAVAGVPRRELAAFLWVVTGMFLVLWLAMIGSAIPGDLPAGRVTYDITSPMHVLDLSVMLPLLAATGWLLLHAKPAGGALGAVLLAKIVTLGLSMMFMSFVFTDDRSLGEVALWAVITAVAVSMLVLALRRISPLPEPWMRRELWC